MADDHLLPLKGERVAISLKPKTAALVYPRVWCPSNQWIPDEIRCYGGMAIEDPHDGLPPLYNVMKRLDEEAGRVISTDEFMHVVKSFHKTFSRPKDDEHNVLPLYFRALARALSHRWDTQVVPMFSSQGDQRRAFFEGDRVAVYLALQDIPIVDENQLSWDQVLEFRKNEDAQNKYKRFLNLLDMEMVNRSQATLEKNISIRLEDYERVLREYEEKLERMGIETTLGTISEILDGKYVLAIAAVMSSAIFKEKLDCGALVAGGLVAGKLIVKLAQERLKRKDIEKKEDSAISWVYEVKKLGQNKESTH